MTLRKYEKLKESYLPKIKCNFLVYIISICIFMKLSDLG